MAAFVFRCPNTGFNVQGWSAYEVSGDEADTYETVTCIACQQTHLVNPATGKVLSSERRLASARLTARLKTLAMLALRITPSQLRAVRALAGLGSCQGPAVHR
jgi:hypothetical protein